MTMWLDAILAYLHFSAIFTLFGFLVAEIVLFRGPLEPWVIRLLGRLDLWYFGSAIVVLVTGFARLVFGAKGPDFYLSAWPIYVKIALFLVVGVMSIGPTLRFIAWRRELEHDPQWRVPDAERAKVRRTLMIEIHVAALIPLMAVIMARGLGH
jgi:putative membrane protein